jgi:hypothetical protein
VLAVALLHTQQEVVQRLSVYLHNTPHCHCHIHNVLISNVTAVKHTQYFKAVIYNVCKSSDLELVDEIKLLHKLVANVFKRVTFTKVIDRKYIERPIVETLMCNNNKQLSKRLQSDTGTVYSMILVLMLSSVETDLEQQDDIGRYMQAHCARHAPVYSAQHTNKVTQVSKLFALTSRCMCVNTNKNIFKCLCNCVIR